MDNIVVIGLGALGRRHLQSLMDLKNDYAIYGVEVNKDALSSLRDEFTNVYITDNISDLPKKIIFCVIATSSNVRRMVFEELMNHSEVRYLLLEKVLFQRIEDYYFVEERLNETGCKAWVNCVRREWGSYDKIKEELKDENAFTYMVTGGEWGLCCNGIHMIDLLQYLSDSDEYTTEQSVFQPGIYDSKRKGFNEIYGTIAGTCGKCSFYQISCMKGNDNPSLVIINSDNRNIIIDEGSKVAYFSRRENNWEWEQEEFSFEYQSQITGRLVSKIIETGNCNLPEYSFSMKTHIKYIDMWLNEFHMQGMEGDLCPIT